MQYLRHFSILFFMFFLLSCGGGGGSSLTVDNSGPVGGGGTTEPPPPVPVYTVALTLLNNDGEVDPATVVSRELPGALSATVTKDGLPMAFELVTFVATGVGVLDPLSGSARTDSNGIATVALLPGEVEGAGTAEASITIDDDIKILDTVTIASLGDASAPPDSDGVNITLVLKNSNTNAVTTDISAAAAGLIEATVTTLDGEPVANTVVTFTTTLGAFDPQAGTALTDDSGFTTILLTAGSVEGAGEITATVGSSQFVLGFVTQGDDSGGAGVPNYQVTLELLNSNGIADPATVISQSQPGSLRVGVTKDGQPEPFKLVTFSTAITGVLNPTLGTAQTNVQGVAAVTLLPGILEGTGTATVSFTTPEGPQLTSTVTFNSAGDGPPVSGPNDAKLSLSLKDDNNSNITTISATVPGVVELILTTFDGLPLAGKVVSFSSTLGEFRPVVGTALTNDNGFASIIINAGTIEGAGEITASFEGNTARLGFNSMGDEIDPNLITADVSFDILHCPDGWDRTARDDSLCTVTLNISSTEPGILFIKALRSGSTVPLASALVSASSTLGRISPDTGTAITDADGIALLDLLAASDVGAGEVEVNVITTTAKKAFEIGAADVTITVDNGLAAGASLSAGATTVITVAISDVDGSPFIPPLNVEFTSNCAVSTPPKAVLDANVTSVGGIATATYRADGCSPEDTVTVTVITGGDAITETVVIPVNVAEIGSMEFVGVSNNYLSLKGTGGQGRSETSVVEFRLLDENGNSVPQKEVIFELTNDAGGISISPVTAQSNNEGLVQTVVRSGDVPGAVRVLAYSLPLDGEPNNHSNRISAVSDILIISTGLPDNNSFTLSPAIFNPEALEFNGEVVDITVFMADHFNNPVPDGTAVVLTTEGGSVKPGCTTVMGACTVEWVSQDVRPFTDITHYQNSVAQKCDPYFGIFAPCTLGIINADLSRDRPLGGRATIMAHAVGEESFTDLNGNGVFDAGEYYDRYDLTEAFIDHNENNVYDGISCADPSDPCAPGNSDGGEFEEFWDFNNNDSYDLADGVYNGFLCSSAALASGHCKWEPLHVRQNVHITMSGSHAVFRVVTGTNNGTCDNRIPLNADGTPVVVDGNGDPLVIATLESSDVVELCDISMVDLSVYIDSDGNDKGIGTMPMRVYFSDIFNNPMPAGTGVTIATNNGILSGTTSMTVGSTNSVFPQAMNFAISRESEGNQRLSGSITITITTPKQIISTTTIAVFDDR